MQATEKQGLWGIAFWSLVLVGLFLFAVLHGCVT